MAMVDLGLNWSSGMANGLLMQPVLAQVNFGGNPAALLGIALAVGGAGLYLLRSVRPQVARDYDIALSAVALLAGAILFFQGWRLDPILTFGNFLLAGAATFFALETIRLRGATTEQAKRYTPMVDDERPVSRVYRAELDEMGQADERPVTRRIRASRDYRDAEDYTSTDRRPSRGLNEAPDDRSRQRSDRPSASGRGRPPAASPRRSPGDRPSSRSRRPDWDEASPARYDESFWSEEANADANYEEPRGSAYSSGDRNSGDRNSSDRNSGDRSASGSARPRRPRPPIVDADPRRSPRGAEDAVDYPADYADYQTIDYGDAEPDNSSNFD